MICGLATTGEGCDSGAVATEFKLLEVLEGKYLMSGRFGEADDEIAHLEVGDYVVF